MGCEEWGVYVLTRSGRSPRSTRAQEVERDELGVFFVFVFCVREVRFLQLEFQLAPRALGVPRALSSFPFSVSDMVSMGRFCGLVSVFVVHAVSLQDWHDPVFQHPAGWHSSSDISRIRSRVSAGDEPWQSAALRLLNDTSLTSDYEPSAKTTVCRGTGGKECGGSMELERDSMAAYYLMLRWIASGGDAQWSKAAARIVDAWSSTLVNFTGHDQMLAAGIYGAHFAQAAELVAVADPEWKGKARAQKMFAEVFHPVCEWFCGGATQQVQRCDHGANGNWDASCMSGVASWAVFLDNRTMLETVANYYRNGRGNGRLTHYVYPSGQAQESGRDQAHTQDGLEHLLETALL